MKRFILVTDLDNTLIGDNDATLNLNEHLLGIREQFYLFYATGRNFDSVAHLMGFFQLLTHQSLLTPDYLIASVGTVIYHRSYPELGWQKHIDRDWHRERIAEALRSFADFYPQSDREQNPWKLSFYLSTNDHQVTISKITAKLSELGLKCNIIFSSRNNIDIVPVYANKGLGIKWLKQQLNITNLPTLVCGDSGNDISMYEQGFMGVIVKNAQPELLSWYEQNPSPQILLSDKEYAWAILDGLHYFDLLTATH